MAFGLRQEGLDELMAAIQGARSPVDAAFEGVEAGQKAAANDIELADRRRKLAAAIKTIDTVPGKAANAALAPSMADGPGPLDRNASYTPGVVNALALAKGRAAGQQLGVDRLEETIRHNQTTEANSPGRTELTPEEQLLAEAMAEGRIQASALGQRDRARIVAAANAIAAKRGDKFSSFAADVRAGTEKAFGYGKPGQNATSLNTAIGHLSDMMGSFKELENTDIRLLNTPINALKRSSNSPAAIAAEANLVALRGELANVFKATGATDPEIAAWHGVLNADLTPMQVIGIRDKLGALLDSRLKALEYQRDRSGGTGGDLLSPKSRDFLTTIEKGRPDATGHIVGQKYKMKDGNMATYLGNGEYE